MLRLTLLLAVLSLVALTTAAPALAQRDAIIEDCQDGDLDGKYSASELRDARKNLPSDVAEYTDCADVIRRGELPSGGGSKSGASGAAGGGGPTAGGGGGAAPTSPASPDEKRKLEQVAASGGEPVAVGGREVVPGASGLTPDAARNGIPVTLAIVLALLLLAGLVAAAPALRRRLREGDWPWRGGPPGLPGRG